MYSFIKKVGFYLFMLLKKVDYISYKLNKIFIYFNQKPEYAIFPGIFIISLIGFVFYFLIYENISLKIFDFLIHFSYSDYIFLFLFFSFLPYAFFTYKKMKRIDFAENALPELLLDISRRISSGFTLAKSFESLSFSKKNEFTNGIKAGSFKMSLGMNFKDSFSHFENFGSDILKNVISIIALSEKTGGNTSISFRIASVDVLNQVILKRNRRSERMSYAILLFLSFLIFLFIFLISIGPLSNLFFTDTNIVSQRTFFNILKDAFYIQSFFSGAVLGKIVFNKYSPGIFFLYLFSTPVFVSFFAVSYFFIF